MEIIIDSRGKKMVRGGRHQAARQARWLRSSGCGNAAARSYIVAAATAYTRECDATGWTAGQLRHNRRAEITGMRGHDK